MRSNQPAMKPLISICIPAYKNAAYLDVLLRSIAIQNYTDFEVVVTDDSPTDEVKVCCAQYQDRLRIIYQKNIPAKGSPANWNAAIALANGDWVKIMHDDDWFATEGALNKYAAAINQHPTASFIFSAFNDYENGVFKQTHSLSNATIKRLVRSPLYLFKKNFIGNPSNVLLRKSCVPSYDEQLKWVVDFEFYIRCLQAVPIHYIPEALINVGYNQDQITKQVFRNRSVEIPENIYLLNKLGIGALKNIIVFDYYWRLFRNLNMRDLPSVYTHLQGNSFPQPLERMLQWQFRIPLKLLKMGLLSKAFMSIAYFRFIILYRNHS